MKLDSILTVCGMAAKNLARHRVKTIITVTAIAVSVSLYIFMDAWLLGMNLDSRRNIVNYETGAAKIQTDAYFDREEELPMYESFTNWEPVVQALEDSLYNAAPRFVFTGTLYSREGTAPVVFNAVDVERESDMLRYGDYVESGRMIEAGAQELILGTLAAEKLHVGIPGRASSRELEEELVAAARTEADAAFIRSLYVPWRSLNKTEGAWAPKETDAVLDDRMALKPDLSQAERERFWTILADSGRNDVRIVTTIDSAELPDSVDSSRYERDLYAVADSETQAAYDALYRLNTETGYYELMDSGESDGGAGLRARVLRAMLNAGYPGAVRHVNQLIDAVVVGVVNAPNPAINASVGWMPIDALQDESGLMLGGAVTEILVRAADARDENLPGAFEAPETISAAVEAALAKTGGALPAGVSVRSWKDYVPDYFAASNGDQVSSRLMIFFLFVLSFIGIANTMLMAILERTKEIGMLRALGMTDKQLLFSYVFEATLIGIIGGVIGAILGCLMNIPMVTVGVDYSGMTNALNGDIGYRIATYFRSAWNFPTVGYTFVGASVLSGLMAIPPTLRALSMPVTESLRFE